jgi:ribosomal-protein-alanine N-acetyltransferase
VDFGIRDFRRADFGTLWQIDQSCFPPGIAYSKAELRAYVWAPRVFTLVAEIIGADSRGIPILGFIVAHASPTKSAHIITIDVVSAGRRSGVGSALLAAAEERLRGANCDGVRLETAVDNLPAQKFYERHGYKVVKRITGYYSTGLDAFVLTKSL